MENLKYRGNYADNNKLINIELLTLQFTDENGIKMIYAPQLDLTGYGDSLKNARKSFEFVLKDFIDFSIENSTLETIFLNYGWIKQKPDTETEQWIAPSIRWMLQNNQLLSEVLDSHKKVAFSYKNLELKRVA